MEKLHTIARILDSAIRIMDNTLTPYSMKRKLDQPQSPLQLLLNIVENEGSFFKTTNIAENNQDISSSTPRAKHKYNALNTLLQSWDDQSKLKTMMIYH